MTLARRKAKGRDARAAERAAGGPSDPTAKMLWTAFGLDREKRSRPGRPMTFQRCGRCDNYTVCTLENRPPCVDLWDDFKSSSAAEPVPKGLPAPRAKYLL